MCRIFYWDVKLTSWDVNLCRMDIEIRATSQKYEMNRHELLRIIQNYNCDVIPFSL